ncbi:MAG: hypothetical protein CEO21_387, partial [Microgenomates group bacterium Gr01-1014_80]
ISGKNIMSRYLEANLDFVRILSDVERDSAISVPALIESRRVQLLQETCDLTFLHYFHRPIGSVSDGEIPNGSKFRVLSIELQESIGRGEIWFNNLEVLEYLEDPRGVEVGTDIHRDGGFGGYTNYICIFKLEGKGQFLVYENLNGDNPKELDSSPGNLIIMKPDVCHAFTRVKPPAYSFALRQKLKLIH